MVRPVRETMGTIVGKDELKWLFLAGFLAVCGLVPIYAFLVRYVSRTSIARVVFHAFACMSLLFCWILRTDSGMENLWIARTLFVWISVFGIFSTSIFWSVLADLFSSQQAKRLFGRVASGGTIGAICGSLATRGLADHLAIPWLMVFPAVLLEIGLVFCRGLEFNARAWNRVSVLDHGEMEEAENHSGSLLSGVSHVWKSGYLLRVCAFLMLVQAFGTLLYVRQAEIVKEEIVTTEAKIKFFANVDLWSQSLTLGLQFLVAGWLMRKFGVALALILLPFIYFASLYSLAISPELSVLAVVMVATRSCAYGFTVPAREVLFTVVSREDKYKAKNFIDTVVVRGGDTLSMQLIGFMQGLGVPVSSLSIFALPLAIYWAYLAWMLGKKQADLQKSSVSAYR